MSKKLVLFAEGEGEVDALPVLAKKLLTEKDGWDALHLDKAPPFKVGGIPGLVKDDFAKWRRLLGAALKRGNVGAILVILDGDIKDYPPGSANPFCAASVAVDLANAGRIAVGAGIGVSLAVVLACPEYETWLIASLRSLAGTKLPDAKPPKGNLEQLRGAKEWLSRNMIDGYKPTVDQARLTEMIEFAPIRERRDVRSFRRLECAMDQLIRANRDNAHVCTPVQADTPKG